MLDRDASKFTKQVADDEIVTFDGHAHEAMLTGPDRFIEEVLVFIRDEV